MTERQPPVKLKAPGVGGRLLAWIDQHPRLGWYLAVMSLLNLLLNLIHLIQGL
jgi:hypothetical protein